VPLRLEAPQRPGRAAFRRVRPGLALTGGLVLAAVEFGLLNPGGPAAWLAVVMSGSVLVPWVGAGVHPGHQPDGRQRGPQWADAAAEIAETRSEVAVGGGIAALGGLLIAVDRGQVADTVPAGIPTRWQSATPDTLGGAGRRGRAAQGAARHRPTGCRAPGVHPWCRWRRRSAPWPRSPSRCWPRPYSTTPAQVPSPTGHQGTRPRRAVRRQRGRGAGAGGHGATADAPAGPCRRQPSESIS
jgi:hypothetical protein